MKLKVVDFKSCYFPYINYIYYQKLYFTSNETAAKEILRQRKFKKCNNLNTNPNLLLKRQI